jgi:hypothetical protein
MNEAAGSPIRAMVLLDTTPVDSHVFLRGNPGRPGEKVERRLPKLLGGAAVARESSGRLDLARAIVAPTNPLAPRVIVNWAWTHHFGRGLHHRSNGRRHHYRGRRPCHRLFLFGRHYLSRGHYFLGGQWRRFQHWDLLSGNRLELLRLRGFCDDDGGRRGAAHD